MVYFVLALLTGTVLAPSALAESYAEAFAGLAFPTGMQTDVNGQSMSVGSFGTDICISGLFPLTQALWIAPTATFISTSAHALPDHTRSNYDLDYRQNDAGIDLLFRLPSNRRVRLGVGGTYAWWTAATKYKVVYNDYTDQKNRKFGSADDWLFRVVGHWMLRSPGTAGVTVKTVVAFPVVELAGAGDESEASGYAGVNVGFSMPLSR